MHFTLWVLVCDLEYSPELFMTHSDLEGAALAMHLANGGQVGFFAEIVSLGLQQDVTVNRKMCIKLRERKNMYFSLSLSLSLSLKYALN